MILVQKFTKWLTWDPENYIFPKVTKMGSITGHKIVYNGAQALRGQRHLLKKKLTQVTPHPRSPPSCETDKRESSVSSFNATT